MFPADVQRDLTDDECDLYFVLVFKKTKEQEYNMNIVAELCLFYYYGFK